MQPSEYFASLASGFNPADQLSKMALPPLQIAMFYYLSELISEMKDIPATEVRKEMVKATMKILKARIEEDIKLHTEMCQTPLGKLLGSVTGDGEDLRLKSVEAMKKIEEILNNLFLQEG